PRKSIDCGMESAMRTGCLGLLVLLMTGAPGADVRAQDGRAGDTGPASTSPSLISSERVEVLPAPTMRRPLPGPTSSYPTLPGNNWSLMQPADGGSGQPPAGQQGTTDGSSAQTQQQPQQQQVNDAQAKRDADLAALRRDQYGPREGIWAGAGPMMWWLKQ